MSPRIYPLYIFDLDGTLFRGEEPIPGAADALKRLREAGPKIRYLTNNSGLTKASYVQKLTRLGFQVEESEVYSSATGAAALLTQRGFGDVFVVGEPGLHQTLSEAGIDVLNSPSPNEDSPLRSAQAVVVGICKSFNYDLLNEALQELLVGAHFFATNTDATYPMEGGRVIPGAGSIVAAVQTCCGRAPEVIGKPEPFLIKLILDEAGVEPGDALAVGDRVETDILAGQRAGCNTMLVLTGVTNEAPPGQATLPSVADLIP